MRILITGGKGMLGRTLMKHWQAEHTCRVADLPETDVLDQPTLAHCFEQFAPEVVVHCVAMTQVDACESDPLKAKRLNETATANVAACAAACGARLIAISTDYVFSGDEPGDRLETDPTAPKTVYGATKLAGEQAALAACPNAVIARIAWLYGAGGPSFLHTMLALAKADPTRELKVVDDQFGNPTSTDAVASALSAILLRPELSGVFHLTCEGTTTWHGFAKEIFRLTGYDRLRLLPCTTADFPRPAPRPHYSSLSKRKLAAVGLPPMPLWQDALAAFLATELAH